MSLSPLCLFSIFCHTSPSTISYALSQKFVFQRGKLPYSYTRHTIPTNHQSCPTALLFPPRLQTSALFHNEESSASLLRGEIKIVFFMSGGEITQTKEGHSEEKVVFRLSELNCTFLISSVLLFSVSFSHFLFLLHSTSFFYSCLSSSLLLVLLSCLFLSSYLFSLLLLFSTCRP